MEGYLLKSSGNTLGIAVINEVRRIKAVAFMALDNRLHLTYSDGREETLPTEIDGIYTGSLLARKQVIIGHFESDRISGEPTLEYIVPLHV